MRTGRAVTVGAVLVAVWILKLILFTVVLAASATLAQLDDLHMLDGGVVAVLAAKSAAGAAAGLAVSRGRSVLFTLTAGSVTLASLDSLDVFHLLQFQAQAADRLLMDCVRARSGKSPWKFPLSHSRVYAHNLTIERLHVTSHVQVVVYSLGLTVLIILYGTLAYLRMKLFLKNEAHRCRVGRKGRQMVPRTAFKSTFDRRKRKKRHVRRETVEQRTVRK